MGRSGLRVLGKGRNTVVDLQRTSVMVADQDFPERIWTPMVSEAEEIP